MADTDVFKHSTPSLLRPVHGAVAFRAVCGVCGEAGSGPSADAGPGDAAGTGIVTRAVSEAVPEATIVATDINPAVVEFAAQVEQALQTWGGTQAPMSAHIATAVP
jgi:hypothetical protein